MDAIQHIIPAAVPERKTAKPKRAAGRARTTQAASPSSIATGSPPEWPDTQASLEERSHKMACEGALRFRNAAYRTWNVTQEDMEEEVRALSLLLAEVPPDEILGLMRRVIQGRTHDYPPKAPELYDLWHGREWVVQEGRRERVAVANASAYLPLQPTANELAWRNAKALPEAEQEGRQAWVALGQMLHAGDRRAGERGPALDDESILARLRQQCNFPPDEELPPELREMAIAFGRWWATQLRPKLWGTNNAKDAWRTWQLLEAGGRGEGEGETGEMEEGGVETG